MESLYTLSPEIDHTRRAQFPDTSPPRTAVVELERELRSNEKKDEINQDLEAVG